MENQPAKKKELPAFEGSPPEETGFHQERFNTMAREYEKSPVKKILNLNAKMSPKDFAHTEAIRDDADFERRKDEEFHAWEKNLKVVVGHLLEKRDHGTERKDIRPLLLILGGGMKGASGAGQALIGLPAVGLDTVFDTVVGISAGAPTAAYFIGGREQSAKGASIFYEECTEGEFINTSVKRLPRIMDIDVVTEAMSHGEKALEKQKVLDSRTDFFVVATGKKDGRGELIDAKTAQPGMMNAIAASMAVPIAYKKAIEVNGKEYVDGTFSPVPLEEIVKKFNPTDILVLPQVPFNRTDAFELNFGEKIVAEFAHRFDSLNTVEKFLRIKEEIRKSMEYIQKQKGVHIGVLWPPDSALNPLTTDPDQVEAAVMESARGVIRTFGAEQPGKLDIFHSRRQ